MIGESKYCSDMVKKHFNKELVMTKIDIKNLRTQLNVGSVIMIISTMMLKLEIIVISLENIKVLHIEMTKSMLN